MCIYFIQAEQGGLIKIGYSNNPTKRLYGLQMFCPIALKILATIKDAPQSSEQSVHFCLSKWRQYGEWFNPSQEVMDFIKINATPFEPQPIPIFDEDDFVSVRGVPKKRCKGYSTTTSKRCCNAVSWRNKDYCSRHKP